MQVYDGVSRLFPDGVSPDDAGFVVGFQMVGGFLIVDIVLQSDEGCGNGWHGGRIDGIFWPGTEEVDQDQQERNEEPPFLAHCIKFVEFIKFLQTKRRGMFSTRKFGRFGVLSRPNGNKKYSNYCPR